MAIIRDAVTKIHLPICPCNSCIKKRHQARVEAREVRDAAIDASLDWTIYSKGGEKLKIGQGELLDG